MTKFIRSIIPVLLLFACSQTPPPVVDERSLALDRVSGTRIRATMEALSGDDMEGREAGTDAYIRAAAYLEGRYREIGLEPFGDNGTYMQNIEFFETRLDLESAEISVTGDRGLLELILRDDYVMGGGYGAADRSVEAPLVFIGHGITAPEYGHDDYEGIDVTGKILVMFSGAPPQFGTDQRAFYSSSGGKSKRAIKHGAVGTIKIRTPVDQARTPWSRFLPGLGKPGLHWLQADGTAFEGFTELHGSAVLSETAAKKLFQFSGHDLAELFEQHANGETGSFEMGVSATIASSSSQRTITSANVVGLLRGSDAELRDEYVVYTAHLDHIGIRPGDDGDDIHNGTYDNSSGISAITEIAAALATMPVAPRRSILFVALTAEEKGLQGSSYFAANPPVPVNQLVANINIDMPYLAYPMADITAFGVEHSTLYGQVLRATDELGLELTPDQMPEQVRFVRSDQFSFVKRGIPAVAFKNGTKSRDPKLDGEAMLDDFLKNHYHRPSDDLDLPYSSEGATQFVQAALLLGLNVANDEERPRWNENDFFGDKFAPSEAPQ